MRLPPSTPIMLAAALVAGCATSPQYMAMTINAKPGQYDRYMADIHLPPDDSAETLVLVKFKKLQPSDAGWAPVIGLCVQGEDPNRDLACLYLFVDKHGSVVPERFSRLGGESSKPATMRFPQRYDVRDELLVRIDAADAVSSFSVNG